MQSLLYRSFFDSEQGTAALRSITSDGPVPNLSMDKLKKLEVPLPSLDIQNRIAMKYQAAMDEISMLKLKLEKATDRLHHIYDEESGEWICLIFSNLNNLNKKC